MIALSPCTWLSRGVKLLRIYLDLFDATEERGAFGDWPVNHLSIHGMHPYLRQGSIESRHQQFGSASSSHQGQRWSG